MFIRQLLPTVHPISAQAELQTLAAGLDTLVLRAYTHNNCEYVFH